MFLGWCLALILTREQSTNTNNVIRSKSPANNKSLLALARLLLCNNVTSSQEEILYILSEMLAFGKKQVAPVVGRCAAQVGKNRRDVERCKLMQNMY